jgi:CheY-like chemotaxis protein
MLPVMIVEDDRDIRESLVAALEMQCIAARHAEHGADALEQLRQSRELPGLIFLDLTMPIMDGQSFLSIFHAEPQRIASIPVVILSADTAIEAAVLNVAGHLHKPVDLKDIFRWIDKTCRVPKSLI